MSGGTFVSGALPRSNRVAALPAAVHVAKNLCYGVPINVLGSQHGSHRRRSSGRSGWLFLS